MPLADKARPTRVADIVGQDHIIGPNTFLRRMIETKSPKSCVFFGPPGTGKSTVAEIIASTSKLPFARLNGTVATTKDLQAVLESEDPNLLYLDEIQYLNKKQQQTLLPYVESGHTTLIAATTENPWHDIYDALLSRCQVLEFRHIPTVDIETRLSEVLIEHEMDGHFSERAIKTIARTAEGDMRRALNLAEALEASYAGRPLDASDVVAITPSINMAGFDIDGDVHYSRIAALQKSIRGSDPDAATLWLNELLEGGDIISPSRRMLVMASEDIGLADPMAVGVVLSCVQAAERLGLPEARFPLTQAAIYLAMAPKSNSVGKAFSAATRDIRDGRGATVPKHIASEHPKDYIYPHDYPYHWCPQRYMPDDLSGTTYYLPGENPTEQTKYQWWQQVRQAYAQQGHDV